MVMQEPEWKGEKNGTDNWSFGCNSFSSWDYLFISTNIRTLTKIPYVTTGHAVDLLRDDNV
jgi:hypothetical protein